jgi:hypothetical protein
MPKDIKRGDKAASPRSRKNGQLEQDKMTAQVEQLAGRLPEILGEEFIQVEVEPILNKLNKKKLN